MTLNELRRLVREGEGPGLEFKRTTGELSRGLETICAFLNTEGGQVLFGVGPKGTIEGQQVSSQTLHEITQAFSRFEPPAVIKIERVKIGKGREILVLNPKIDSESLPFTFDGRPYERVGNTTRKMPQHRYESLLFERAHATRRWENQPAEGVRLKDLDHEEILATREAAIAQRRISAGTSRDIGDILDRLGLRVDGKITQAAQVLYGTKFLPYYAQCLLKMGRFRGTKITGEIVDNKQEHLHAFAVVREGMAFLDRTLPLGARFPEGKIFREDRLPIPPNALREILLNAVMHRDYSDYGGHIAIAIFDDRVEIRSAGKLPAGVTVDQLSGPHLSKLRNLLIAGTFHRTGAVEIWGRGTDRVVDECKQHGIDPPIFEERQGFLIVTFRAQVVVTSRQLESQPESQLESRPESLDRRVLIFLENGPLGKAEIAARMSQKKVSGQLNKVIRELVSEGLIVYTIPEKPNSRLQRYQITKVGKKLLEKNGESE